MFSSLMDSYLKLEAPKKFCFHLCYEKSEVFLTGYQRRITIGRDFLHKSLLALWQYDVTSDNLLLVLARLPALGDMETRTTSARQVTRLLHCGGGDIK